MSEEIRIPFGKLTHLLLGNFKAFKRTQRIPIRPITLIYGKNNSGKSSIIQALLYAEHVRRTGQLDPSVIVKDNHRLLEGGLARLAHGRNSKHRPRFGWEWVNPGSPTGLISGRYEQELDAWELVLKAVLNGQDLIKLTDPYESCFDPSPRKKNPISPPRKHPSYLAAIANVQRWLANDLRLWTTSPETSAELREVAASFCEDLEHGRFKADIENVLFAYMTGLQFRDRSLPSPLTFRSEQQEVWDRPMLNTRVGVRGTSRLARGNEKDAMYVCELEGQSDDALTGDIKGGFEKYVEGFIGERGAHLIYKWLEDVWEHFSAPLKKLVGTIHYLGAARSRPGTLFLRDPSDLAPKGKESDRPAPPVPQHRDWIFQQSAFDQANRWLRTNKLLTGNVKLRYEELHPVETRNKDPHRASPAGVATTFSLYDRERKISLGLDEVGYGLSQFIPVLLACFARQDHYAHESAGTLLVEEPEAHIHPALQSEIGDLFIEAVTRAEYPLAHVICETHSEHLLLRIMRRIREGTLSPAKVAVLYVENLGKESIVREMPLNEKGELIRDWPGGFFEEGLREVLQ